jgi:Carboxypeptidase regulatory-like domain
MNAFTCTQRLSSRVKKVGLFLVPVLALLVVSGPVFPQGSTGTIRGAIFDSSGGVIAGAQVTVTDVARGTARNLTTGPAGQFVAPSLNAGTYTVRGEAAGFQAVERDNVLLGVAATVRVDLTLAPGEQTQTITVTEEIPAIDPTSATLGGTVSNQAIVDLPLNGRNFLQLLQLRPGVVDLPGASGNATSTNGRRQGADVILIEGVTQFDLATSNVLINGNNNGAPGATLPIDAIQEFNTQQNAPAEYGWRDGSIVNVGIKSGTNGLHGTAYAFGRDAQATDARDYFSGLKTNLAREQFGATAGGPVIKDKLFWFVGYEGIRETQQNTTQISAPLSTTAGGLGDPSKSMVDACNAVKSSGTINPLSAQLAGLDIATCTVSPETATFQNMFFYNTTGDINVNSPHPSISPGNNGLAKVDWNVTERHHLNGLFFISKAQGSDVGAVKPYWGSSLDGTVYEYVGSWTWTINSGLLNDFRFGTASTRGNESVADHDRLPSAAFPTGYSFNTGVTNPDYAGFPCINFVSGFDPLGTCGKPGQRGPQGQLNIRDSVSYLTGNHAFRFGGEMVFVKFNNSTLSNVQGTLEFAGLQEFLAGTLTSGTGNKNITGGDLSYGLRERWYSAFFGDTWRVTSRLTLTPGLRYEYMGPPHEVDNHLGTFDPNATATGGLVQVGPGLPTSKLFSPQKANFSPRIGVAWDITGQGKTVLRGGFGLMSSFPSITSFVQAVPYGSNLINGSGTTVVDHTGEEVSQAAPFTVAYDPSQLTWDTTGPLFPNLSGGASPCSAAAPCQTGAPDPNFKYPKSLQWNMDVQRALTNNLTLDVAYVGNHGFDETLSRDLNAVPVGTSWTSTILGTCSLQTTAAAASNSTAYKNACKASSAAIVAARPYNADYPWFNYIVRATSGGWSNYNGLQVTLDGRNYHGVSFLASYTYSHSLDTWSRSSQAAALQVDPANYGYQYGNGDRDIRHRARFSPRWQIPGIKTPGQMLEGWSLSGILSLQGGFAWGPIDQTKNDWAGNGATGNANSRPNNGVFQTWNYSGPTSAFNSNAHDGNTMPCYGRLSGCSSLTAAPSAIITACETAAQAPYTGNAQQMKLALLTMYNNACYIRDGGVLTPPAYGTIGNAGRNQFKGPSYTNVDLTLSKDWHVGERYSAQLRVEVFNLFNTPSFALPVADVTKGFNGFFGYTNSTAADPRRMQFGLKLGF